MPRKPSEGNVGDRYGWRIHPVTKQRSFHHGLDIGWRAGRTLVAPESGRVVAYQDRGNWGRRLDLQGDSGALHYLAHTESRLVNVDARVAEGDHVAVMGDTGRVTGIHVHWEVHVDGASTDPEAWLARTASTITVPITEEDDMPTPRTVAYNGARQFAKGQEGYLWINAEKATTALEGPCIVSGSFYVNLSAPATVDVVAERQDASGKVTSRRNLATADVAGRTEISIAGTLAAGERLRARLRKVDQPTNQNLAIARLLYWAL